MRRAALLALALAAGCRAVKAPAANPRLAALESVLASRNDNDPRLDTAFDGLSEADKAAFRDKYRAMPPERRNERGTIVYLLGRNATGPEDWAFLRAVAAEPPCLSLSDCAKPPSQSEPGDAVTLAYPALVALRRAQSALEKDPADKEGRALLEAARASKAPAVQRMVKRIDDSSKDAHGRAPWKR